MHEKSCMRRARAPACRCPTPDARGGARRFSSSWGQSGPRCPLCVPCVYPGHALNPRTSSSNTARCARSAACVRASVARAGRRRATLLAEAVSLARAHGTHNVRHAPSRTARMRGRRPSRTHALLRGRQLGRLLLDVAAAIVEKVALGAAREGPRHRLVALLHPRVHRRLLERGARPRGARV